MLCPSNRDKKGTYYTLKHFLLIGERNITIYLFIYYLYLRFSHTNTNALQYIIVIFNFFIF